jgi:hypothetical protein
MMLYIQQKQENKPAYLREWANVIDSKEFNAFTRAVHASNPDSDIISEYTVIGNTEMLEQAMTLLPEIDPDVFITTPNPNMRVDFKVEGQGTYQTSIHCFGKSRIEELINLDFPIGGSIPIGYLQMFHVPEGDGMVHRCGAMLTLTTGSFIESPLHVEVGALCLPDSHELNAFIEQWKYSNVPMDAKDFDAKDEIDNKFGFTVKHWKTMINFGLRYWTQVQYILAYPDVQYVNSEPRPQSNEPKVVPLFRTTYQEHMPPKVYGPKKIDLNETINEMAKRSSEHAYRNRPRPHWRRGTWVTRNGKTFWREGGWVNSELWEGIPKPRKAEIPQLQQPQQMQ